MKMRKFRFLAVALLGASSMFLTSCEEDTDPLAPSPQLTVVLTTSDGQTVTNADVTVPSSTTLSFAIEALKSGDSDLDVFSITRVGNSITPFPATLGGYDYSTGSVSLKNADDEVYRDTVILNGNLIVTGTYSLTFQVTAKNGQSTSRTIQVTVANSTPLATEVNGAFFHIEGSEKGSYDLVAEAQVAAADPDANKDMANNDMAGAPFTGSWEAKNATDFVVASGFDYANATEEAATDAYNAGTAVSSVSNPQVDDVYIAKLRGAANYAVIKITKVDAADNTCNCGNTGIIEFDFKKK